MSTEHEKATPRPFYTRALSALEAAHNACFKNPERGLLGMSSGPFAGVNEALGIVSQLEDDNSRLMDNVRLLAATLIWIQANPGASATERQQQINAALALLKDNGVT